MKKTIVNLNNTRVKESRKGYWDHTFTHNKYNEAGEVQESIRANPDSLSENALDAFQRGPNSRKATNILEDAVETLTDKQRSVYVAVYRDGRAQAGVADEMGLTQQAVSRILNRALKSIQAYCDDYSEDSLP